MNLDILYIDIRDTNRTKRYLAYKQTAEMNDLAMRYDFRGFFHSKVGSFKVFCRVCHDHIGEGQVAKTSEGFNFLVTCRCTKGKQKRFSATDDELSNNSGLAIAYLKALWSGKLKI